uniref:Uncharacterized protein n=1 Tax=Arundo donax TaxID=35708 RepID=A0A0A9BPV4_ARUDO
MQGTTISQLPLRPHTFFTWLDFRSTLSKLSFIVTKMRRTPSAKPTTLGEVERAPLGSRVSSSITRLCTHPSSSSGPGTLDHR